MDALSITPPGGATDSIRWAMPTWSPIAVYPVAVVPISPAITCPEFSPIRNLRSTPSRRDTSSARSLMPRWMSKAARHARSAWSSTATGAPNTAMIPSPVNLSRVPPYRFTTAAARSTSCAMISRSRSAPTAEAMSMECTTSANRTVTCLYSARVSPSGDWCATPVTKPGVL